VMLRALAKNREERFESVQAFQKALAEASRVEMSGLAVRLARDPAKAGERQPNTLASAAAEIKDTIPTVSLHSTAQMRRPLRWAWALGGALALVLVAMVVLALAFSGSKKASQADSTAKGAMDEGRAGAQGHGKGAAGIQGESPTTPPEVTLEFQGLPAEGRIILGGKELSDAQVKVPRSPWMISFQVKAPGYLTTIGNVTPDRDRVVQLHLAPAPQIPDAGAPEKPGAPDAAAPDASPAVATPPGMAWGVIMGRQGTSVKTDYDADE